MKTQMKTIAFAAVAAAVAGSACAQDKDNAGAYVFGSVGWSKAQTENAREISKVASAIGYNSTISSSEDSVGLKIGGGYRFNDYLALEGAYYWLGESTYRVNLRRQSSSSAYSANVKFDLNGYLFAADIVGYCPVTSQLDVFGKVGFGIGIVNVDNNTIGRHDDDGDWYYSFAPKLGIGAEFKFPGDHFAVRAEYEHIWNVGTSGDFGSRIDYDFVTVGVKYKF